MSIYIYMREKKNVCAAIEREYVYVKRGDLQSWERKKRLDK